MSRPLDHGDLETGVTPAELAALQAVSERLERERPVPRASFRGDLRRHLMARRSLARPARLRLQIAFYGVSGLVLLLTGASSAGGLGPLAA